MAIGTEKYQILKEITNIWFLLYLLGVVIFVVVAKIPSSVFLKIASVIILLLFHLAYVLRGDFDPIQKKSNIFSFIIMLALGLAYIAAYVKEIIIAVNLIFAVILFIIIVTMYVYIRALLNSKNVWLVSLFYLIIIVLGIIFFSSIFIIAGAFDGNGLVYNESKSSVTDFRDILFFVASLAYASPIGDVIPMGFSRILMISELAISFIFHSTILPGVVNSIYPNGLFKQKK